ncbi:MAG: energy transducer TonB [Gammaproteobacteria bacterium]|nr:energy transducer TonB [Gammaproteobacteria bacterium]MDE0273711.1 energy transducer TonB [Gammaproteobacteria bacterium]
MTPVYPSQAKRRGIEGYALVEFVVTKNGSVRDPKVIESSPPRVFDRASIAAALKFKYKPKVVNGQPIALSGVRNLFTYELTDG